MASANPYDPIEMARSSPYFKRNHVGKVTCTLCNIYCNDENNFLKHLSGKTHSLQIERMERMELRKNRLAEEERLNAEAAAQAKREQAARELAQKSGTGSGASSSSSSSAAAALIQAGRFGVPLYAFRTEHDEQLFATKVWLEVIFTNAEEGTRPMHRWLSAHEQQMDVPADEYFVYLLVACEGYTTVALRFPAKATRSYEGDVTEDGDSAYLASWDPFRKVYSIYFMMWM